MNPDACAVYGDPADPSRGRYVIATRDIAAGELIAATPNYGFGIYERYEEGCIGIYRVSDRLFSYKKKICNECLQYTEEPKGYQLKCSACTQVFYCSTECQNLDTSHTSGISNENG